MHTSQPTRERIFAIGPAAARAIPFAIYIAFLVLESLLPHDAGFDLRWLYTVKVASVAIALAVLWSRYTELRDPLRASPAAWVGAIAIGIVIFVFWITLDQPWALMGGGIGWNPTDASGALIWPLAIIRIIGAVLIVPVMEELFWRSLVLRWIRNSDFLSVAPAHAGAMALLVSSGLFGVEHHEWLAGIIAGLAYAGTYMRSGNLWCAVVAHAITNLVLGGWVIHTRQWQFW